MKSFIQYSRNKQSHYVTNQARSVLCDVILEEVNISDVRDDHMSGLGDPGLPAPPAQLLLALAVEVTEGHRAVVEAGARLMICRRLKRRMAVTR